MKILMVCLGNICRSPLAEGILKQQCREKGLNWVIDSAGTAGYHVGEAPHYLSQKIAKQNGVDISKQQCRKFVREDIIRYDKIYVMDTENYNDVKNICGNIWNEKKVDLLLNVIYKTENRNVPDPWFGGEEDFINVFEMIDECCTEICKINNY